MNSHALILVFVSLAFTFPPSEIMASDPCSENLYKLLRECRDHKTTVRSSFAEEHLDEIVCRELYFRDYSEGDDAGKIETAIKKIPVNFGLSRSEVREVEYYKNNCDEIREKSIEREFENKMESYISEQCTEIYTSCLEAHAQAEEARVEEGELQCIAEPGAGTAWVSVAYRPYPHVDPNEITIEEVLPANMSCNHLKDRVIGNRKVHGVCRLDNTKESGRFNVQLSNGQNCAEPPEVPPVRQFPTRSCATEVATLLEIVEDEPDSPDLVLLSAFLTGLCSQCMAKNRTDDSRNHLKKLGTCAAWSLSATGEGGIRKCVQKEGWAPSSVTPQSIQESSVQYTAYVTMNLHRVLARGGAGGMSGMRRGSRGVFCGNRPEVLPRMMPGSDPERVQEMQEEVIERWIRSRGGFQARTLRILDGDARNFTPPFGPWRPPEDMFTSEDWERFLEEYERGKSLKEALKEAGL